MTQIKDTKTAKAAAERGDSRTSQALDQAAGGSGDIVTETTTEASTIQDIGPQAGTDDARCEDSRESDRRRKQEAADVSSRIAEVRRSPRSRRQGNDRMSSTIWAR